MNISPTEIDALHKKGSRVLSKEQLNAIYMVIRKHPLKYFLANNYFIKFAIFTVAPFVALKIFSHEIVLPLHLDVVSSLFVLALIWLWFNENTCYVLIKIKMVMHAFLPYTNTDYLLYGSLNSYKAVRVIIFFILLIISVKTSVLFSAEVGPN